MFNNAFLIIKEKSYWVCFWVDLDTLYYHDLILRINSEIPYKGFSMMQNIFCKARED